MKKYIIVCITSIFLFETSCIKDLIGPKSDKYIIDNGEGITLKFIEGLNDNPDYKLRKDQNGYYFFTLIKGGSPRQQNIQRITAQILRNDKPIYDDVNGKYVLVSWSNNLFWWLRQGDTVTQITKRYFNPFLGQYQYVNQPPIINWQDVLIPTINTSSVADQNNGIINTVISPISAMAGDTMIINLSYRHSKTKKLVSGSFISLEGDTLFSASVPIILK